MFYKLKYKYLCVDAKNLYLINYALQDDSIRNNCLIAYTGNNCQEIFEESNISSEYQKVFIRLNPLITNLYRNVSGYEYLTYVPIRIYKNRYYDYSINGEMAGRYPRFVFRNATYCDEKEILVFLTTLKENNMLLDYIKCLGEVTQMNITSKSEKIIKK